MVLVLTGLTIVHYKKKGTYNVGTFLILFCYNIIPIEAFTSIGL